MRLVSSFLLGAGFVTEVYQHYDADHVWDCSTDTLQDASDVCGVQMCLDLQMCLEGLCMHARSV